MTRLPLPWIILVICWLSGCSPPGKPAPAPDGGLPAKVMDFDTLYSSHCAGCHGADGTLGPGPPLNDPLFRRIIPDQELVQVIVNGRSGTTMPPFERTKGGALSAAQIKVLADGLKSKWGHANEPGSSGNVPGYMTTSGGDASRGKMVFITACAACHGTDGKGGTVEGKKIGAINDASFLALTSDQLLRRYIITGRPDLGMPDYTGKSGRSPTFTPLSPQEVSDLAALLASWRKPVSQLK
jgi:cytochrome c oxidase cbb3-type subunit 3